MVGRLILILGDQLSDNLAALSEADKSRDTVVMAEVMEEASYVKHHPKKIAFILASMRKFARRLENDGWCVAYSRLDDADNTQSIVGEVLRRADELDASEVLVTQPGEWRLIKALEECPLKVTTLSDGRFITTPRDFSDWAKGRKSLRMEYFYREVRRKTDILMNGSEPAGGKWNFDSDNRESAEKSLFREGPKRFEPDDTVKEVLRMVEDRFPDNFGDARPFWFATDHAQAEEALAHFLAYGLPEFGRYQDAMLRDDKFLNHAVIGLYLNIGFLDPLDVCKRVEAEYEAGRTPINSAEGFIRQIIGWREFIRGVYFHEGPEYTKRNALGHDRALPAAYWGAETKMACLDAAVAQTREEAYAHHIQRLMVTGNFALLAGVAPSEVHEWYLAVYADAYEWVEAPNTLGMSQFADGGVVGSKPYVSSGAYINRMSDYCRGCSYSVSKKTGEGACPFNLLYWHFLNRHREKFEKNPRMGMIYRSWDKMDASRRETIIDEGDAILRKLDKGEVV